MYKDIVNPFLFKLTETEEEPPECISCMDKNIHHIIQIESGQVTASYPPMHIYICNQCRNCLDKRKYYSDKEWIPDER